MPNPLIPEITTMVAALGFPPVARDGSCKPVSDQICAVLSEAGLDPEVRLVLGTVTYRGLTAVGFAHYVVWVGELVVDATATQFDPDLPSLIVAPVEEYQDLLGAATDATVSIVEPHG